MASAISSFITKTGRATGRFLSNFGYVLTTLIIYVLFSLVTYGVLRVGLGANAGPSLITFIIATGGDPYNFKELSTTHPVVWGFIIVLHVLSWLIVPVLAATAVDAAYRKWEERVRELDTELTDEVRRLLEQHAGLTADDAELAARRMLDDTEKALAIKRKRV